MVGTKTILVNETLIDLFPHITSIEESVVRKIAANMATSINSDIDDRLKLDAIAIKELLSSFESRLRECEIIYYTYLRDASQDILKGNTTDLPLKILVKLNYGKGLFEKQININDRIFYKELIDNQFRHFILAICSEYEVMVKLAETVVRKVILHLPEKRPGSAPIESYIRSLKDLVKLQYRPEDEIYQCISNFEPFFNKFLPTLTFLRNSFSHGFSINLINDGNIYRVKNYKGPLTATSPALELNFFATTVMEESRKFFINMLLVLDRAIKDDSVLIPA